MKPLQAFLAVLLLASAPAHGALSATVNSVIADGNPTGLSSTINVTRGDVTGGSGGLGSVTLTLNISGGYNGDLYAYVSHNGVMVPLINRVGVGGTDAFGYGNTGFTITLSANGANNVHLYQDAGYSLNGNGQLTGIWQPDGRAISPTSDPASFNAAGTVGFSAFNGMDPTGNWTLYVADVVGGGGYGSSTLTSWSMDITAVPEPMNVAAGLFAAVFGGFHLLRFARRKGRTAASVTERSTP